jgi:hypothetical protein
MESTFNKVKMPKSIKTPALVKRVAQKEQPKPLTREQLMDIAARKTAAEMDKVNYDKSIEYRIMNEPDINPLAPKPSERNAASQGGTLADLNADLTFSRAGARFGHTSYMRSRRVG